MTKVADDPTTGNRTARFCLAMLAVAGIGLTLTYSIAHHWTPYAKSDFATYWIAGRMALEGASPYDLQAIAQRYADLTGLSAQPYFSYPPQSLLLFAPIGALPLGVSFWTYQAIGVVLFLIAARPYIPKDFPVLLLLSPAALISIAFGQSGLLFGALWLLSFNGSSAALAALTFRPQLGWLAGIESIRRGTIVRTISILMVIVAITTALFGADVWQLWLKQLAIHSEFLRSDFIFYRQMPVPRQGYGVAGWVLFGAGALYFLSRSFNVFTAATATFLISPHGLHYDMTVVCFGCAILLFESWDKSHFLQRAALTLGFLSPGLVYFGTWFGPPILLVALHAQVQLTRRTSENFVAPGNPQRNSGSGFSFTRWKQALPNKESNTY